MRTDIPHSDTDADARIDDGAYDLVYTLSEHNADRACETCREPAAYYLFTDDETSTFRCPDHLPDPVEAPMIDLTEDPDESPAEIIGKMGAGHPVRTPIRNGDTEESPHVILTTPDSACSECDSVFTADTFGEDTPLFSILANQRLRRGETHCPSCIPSTTAENGD